MVPRSPVKIWVAMAVLGLAGMTVAGSPSPGRDGPDALTRLDVPFVPQSGQLCGGAAVAMLLRYWGEVGVLAEDFAPLAKAGQDGIRTRALVDAVSARGWNALPLSGTRADVVGHLIQGRPIIALVRVGANAYHYVVIVAWADGWVIVHDPNVGPFRAVDQGAFEADWSGSGNWALLVLPPQGIATQDTPAATGASAPAAASILDPCGALMAEGISRAEQGDLAGAERSFLAAQTLSPDSAAPLRERAGLRFRAEDWAGASRLAERALARDPDDAHSWRLLAGSRFLADDVEGALSAWNRLAEPRNDLTRIDGLVRIRHAAVAGQLDLPPGRLLTPHAFRRAQRRLAELPARADHRLDLTPMPGGIAQVKVTLRERPLVAGNRWDLARASVRALVEREVTVDVASPTGNGELWATAWRWWEERPRASLTLTAPAARGRPGIWRVEGFWEQQTYEAIAGASRREERRRTAVFFADWFGPDVRLEVGAALDTWDDRGTHLALEGSVETRWVGDRLAATVAVARWEGVDNGGAFATGGVTLRWRSGGQPGRESWHSRLVVSSATGSAPLALWSGAGTGDGRAPLLRAHPLLDKGVIRGQVFGRSLAQATIERQAWPWRQGPVQIGWAVFIDSARPWHTGRVGEVRWQVDGGAGLRLCSPGMAGQLRLDVARGLSDGNVAGSIAWQLP